MWWRCDWQPLYHFWFKGRRITCYSRIWPYLPKEGFWHPPPLRISSDPTHYRMGCAYFLELHIIVFLPTFSQCSAWDFSPYYPDFQKMFQRLLKIAEDDLTTSQNCWRCSDDFWKLQRMIWWLRTENCWRCSNDFQKLPKIFPTTTQVVSSPSN